MRPDITSHHSRIVVHVNISHVNELIDKTMQGWGHSRGVTKPFSIASLLSEFFKSCQNTGCLFIIPFLFRNSRRISSSPRPGKYECNSNVLTCTFAKAPREINGVYNHTQDIFFQFQIHDFCLTIEYGIPSVICGYDPSKGCSVSEFAHQYIDESLTPQWSAAVTWRLNIVRKVSNDVGALTTVPTC